jgi:hypothetical protein
VPIAEKTLNLSVVGLFVQSLNETIDLHTKRVTAGVRNCIPGLFFAAMGYQSGLRGAIRSLATVVVAFTFTVVIALIADLDLPQEGILTASQQALIDLRHSMR